MRLALVIFFLLGYTKLNTVTNNLLLWFCQIVLKILKLRMSFPTAKIQTQNTSYNTLKTKSLKTQNQKHP